MRSLLLEGRKVDVERREAGQTEREVRRKGFHMNREAALGTFANCCTLLLEDASGLGGGMSGGG